ncbi:hypothetical protein MHYP_G00156820 [Metynnis hypsauchen]
MSQAFCDPAAQRNKLRFSVLVLRRSRIGALASTRRGHLFYDHMRSGQRREPPHFSAQEIKAIAGVGVRERRKPCFIVLIIILIARFECSES